MSYQIKRSSDPNIVSPEVAPIVEWLMPDSCSDLHTKSPVSAPWEPTLEVAKSWVGLVRNKEAEVLNDAFAETERSNEIVPELP